MKELILGTYNGQLHEVTMEEKDKKFLGSISEDIDYVTPTRHYSFTGFGSLEDAFMTFLLWKLDNLEKDEKCQITMISTWELNYILTRFYCVLDT
ncbi:hypothetical protein TSUD_105130 [Trifolium subterraneum]|uniref:Uncharacterized protein n=1 Tax=Trifolium subterraneum TaxID=3900 RepID=A0A2Z6NGX8_TRISU|nr:hypothetical protein TSUD_105130 [Trifolium subterraneum]